MSFEMMEELAGKRFSVRAFEREPVKPELLERIFAAAQQAPSNCNTQPWYTAVVSGDALERLRKKLPEAFMSGHFMMDFPYDGVYEGVYKERQYAAAKALYDAQGITREEKDKRQAAFMKNFEFFDAPHVAFLFLPEPFGLREAADLGMYAQTLMLMMTAAGLGSVPQTALSMAADVVRKELNIDDSNKLLFGISFGYEDSSHPANRCRTDRAALTDATVFIDQ